MKLLVVGSGLSGAVSARKYAEQGNTVLVVDKRNHIGGNCYSERDENGIMIHKYGPHIFHTNNLHIWQYVQKFADFIPYINRPKATYQKQVYSLPINLSTINQFFGVNLTPKEAEKFIKQKRLQIENPQNFEEQALASMGEELYRAFFYGYTVKQWGVEPKDIPASVIKRLPLRFNYNDNYYYDKYQGIPVNGYTEMFENILSHPNIEVKLNTPFEHSMIKEFDRIFYTGPIDMFYNYKFGRLNYRTVFWEKAVYNGDFQGTAGMNYPEIHIPFTRVKEYKHYTPWENHKKTSVFIEYSKKTGEEDEPFYPSNFKEDKERLEQYQAVKTDKVTFLGRLGTYQYLDMDKTIFQALQI